jgi:diguanylate cyclase (GGDEF)-like protein
MPDETAGSRDRIRRVAAEQHAHVLSMRDPLTQLPNRRQFEIETSTALKRPNSRMTILLLGLSQFKKLHDVYGHLGCDAALLQVAGVTPIAEVRAGVPCIRQAIGGGATR